MFTTTNRLFSTFCTVFALAAALGTANSAFAQESKPLTISRVPLLQMEGELADARLSKGVTKAKALRLMETARPGLEQLQSELRETHQARFTALAADTKAEQTRFSQELEKTPGYAAIRAKWDAAQKIESAEARTTAMKAIYQENEGVFADARRRAGISEAGMQAKISRIDGEAVSKGRILAREKSLVNVGPLGRGAAEAEDPAPAPVDSFVLTPPFAVKYKFKSNNGPGLQGTSNLVDREDGKTKAECWTTLVVSNAESIAMVGQAIEVPAGVKRVEVTALHDNTFHLYSISLNGIGGGWSNMLLQVDGVEGKVGNKVKKLGSVISPLAWYAEIEGEKEPRQVSLSFAPAREGGTYQITTGVSVNSYAGLGAKADATNASTCKQIKVRFIR